MKETNLQVWVSFLLGQRKAGVKALDEQHDLNYEVLATIIEKGYDALDREELVGLLCSDLNESEERILKSISDFDLLGGFHVAFGALPISHKALEGLAAVTHSMIFCAKEKQ